MREKDTHKNTIRHARGVQRRRQVLKRRCILGAAAVLLILAGSYAVKLVTEKPEEGVQTAAATDEIPEETPKKAEEEPEKTPEEKKEDELAEVWQSAAAAGAPQGILELLHKNDETIDFVRDYAEKKDNPPAEKIADAITPGEIPSLLQWDERWGYQSYGNSTIAASGCGPTCMAMVIAGLTGDVTATPYKLAQYSEQQGYVDEEGNTYWEFMNRASLFWEISVTESGRDDALIAQELAAGHPIICSVTQGGFTDAGHFIVLTGMNGEMVTVKDPFSIENTEKPWVYADIADQIAAIWIYSK